MNEDIVQDNKEKLIKHEHEIGSMKHRLKDLEEQNKTIQDLVLSVQKLALNMESMLREQKEQGTRISLLEKEPANRLTQIKTAIITALTTALISGAVGAILMFK